MKQKNHDFELAKLLLTRYRPIFQRPFKQIKILDSFPKNQEVFQESYSFVFDLEHFLIKEAVGIKESLGYNQNITVFKYFMAIFPGHTSKVMSFCEIIANDIFLNESPSDIYDNQFIITHGIRCKKKGYYLIKTMVQPYQIDAAGIIVSLLNYSTLICPIPPTEDYDFRIYRSNRLTNLSLEENYFNQARVKVKTTWPFTQKELQILKFYIEDSKSNSSQISQKTKSRVHTIRTHNKNILRKARAYFSIEFKTAAEVGKVLTSTGLLNS